MKRFQTTDAQLRNIHRQGGTGMLTLAVHDEHKPEIGDDGSAIGRFRKYGQRPERKKRPEMVLQ
jgi:hypothetical protein